LKYQHKPHKKTKDKKPFIERKREEERKKLVKKLDKYGKRN